MSFNKPDSDCVTALINGEIDSIDFYKLNDDKTDVEIKSLDDVLSNDTTDENAVHETINYLNILVSDMAQYLSDTDWYVSRYAETGKQIPEDVYTTRSDYRDKISLYREYIETWEGYLETTEETTTEE